MSAAFTPGPWVAHCIDAQHWMIEAPLGHPSLQMSAWTEMVEIYGCDDVPDIGAEVAKANARLIAAAPELLAALIYVQENVADDSPHMWAMVAKAIAAATGEQA